jgi:uncharacterized protein (TIGR03382 family)
MMRIHSLVVVVGLVLGGLPGVAHASAVFLTVVEPSDWIFGLDFGHVPFDRQSATQRIRIRNDGAPGRDLSYIGGPFVIVATGGGLGTGEEQFWDIACAPSGPFDVPVQLGSLNVDVCGSSCSDDEWVQSIPLSCQPGLFDAPIFVSTPPRYAGELTQEVIPLDNPGPSPITITGFASNMAAFSAGLATGSLPLTVAPGQTVDVIVTFDGSAPEVNGVVDVIAGADVATRVRVQGLTLSSITPSSYALGVVPEGARYRLPITVRNSFQSSRAITAAAADLADYAVSGLVGTTLAPGQVARGMLTFTATALGPRNGLVTVAFDHGQGETARFFSEVLSPTFFVITPDAAPADGLLDFGTRKVGSAPVKRTITIVNRDGVERAVVGCFVGSDGFELVGACPTKVPAHGSVSLTVRFTPSSVGDPLGVANLGVAAFGSISTSLTAHVVPKPLVCSAGEPTFPGNRGGERLGVSASAIVADRRDEEDGEGDGHQGGGCSAGGPAGGALSIALLALLRRRRLRAILTR